MSGLADDLAVAETELQAFEAGLWKRIGLAPDGAVDAYLTEADFLTEAKLYQLRERVSRLVAERASRAAV